MTSRSTPRRAPLSRRRLLQGSALATVAGSGVSGGTALAASSASPEVTGTVTGVTRLGSDLFAVGRTEDGSAAVWRGDERGVWQEMPVGPALDGVDLRAVTTYDRTVVAVGNAGPDAVVCSSADGSSWRAEAVGAGALAGVAAAPDATMLAVGGTSDGETNESAGASVLASSDGRVWRRLRTQGLPLGSEAVLTAVVHHRDGWLAASHEVDGAALWTSPDAVTWSPAGQPPGTGVVVSGLAVHDDGVVAVGSSIIGAGAMVWHSRDNGRTWDEAPTAIGHAGDGIVHDVISVPAQPDGHVLLVGAQRGRVLTVRTNDL